MLQYIFDHWMVSFPLIFAALLFFAFWVIPPFAAVYGSWRGTEDKRDARSNRKYPHAQFIP